MKIHKIKKYSAEGSTGEKNDDFQYLHWLFVCKISFREGTLVNRWQCKMKNEKG
jgi:hypothetical protein